LKEAAGDLDRMRAILGCEACYAISPNAGGSYIVRYSNFPFREGKELDVPRMDPQILESSERLPSQRANAWWQVESWFITDEAE
jgi:hypothetical protein